MKPLESNITSQKWHVHQSPRSTIAAVPINLNHLENIEISIEDQPKPQVNADHIQIENI